MNDLQVGSARIVTDYIVLAYLMDAFIDRQHRNKGYLRQLMESMIGNPDLKNIKVWKRATSEAHFLYDPAATLVKTRQHDGKVVDRSVIDIIRGL
ncbi:MAG TPA: hypothetical protein PL029_08075 [Bacteroidia bacterium]|nr:hypothetical protein [Bacteroidia bacterium]